MTTTTAETETATETTPGGRLRALFERFGRDRADDEAMLRDGTALYAPTMRFQDPIQTIDGRDEYLAMCRRLLTRPKAVRFFVDTMVESPTDVLMTWRMDLTPRVGPRVLADGATHCRLDADGLVVWHRDYWDLVGDIVGQVPLVGRAWRGLVKRFG
jgi:hypothetical protein